MVLQVVNSVPYSQNLKRTESLQGAVCFGMWPNGASQWTEGASISRGPGHILSVYLAFRSIHLLNGTWSSLKDLKGCDRQVVNPRWSPSVSKTNGLQRASRAFGLCIWDHLRISQLWIPRSIPWNVGISFQVETPVQLLACLNLGKPYRLHQLTWGHISVTEAGAHAKVMNSELSLYHWIVIELSSHGPLDVVSRICNKGHNLTLLPHGRHRYQLDKRNWNNRTCVCHKYKHAGCQEVIASRGFQVSFLQEIGRCPGIWVSVWTSKTHGYA